MRPARRAVAAALTWGGIPLAALSLAALGFAGGGVPAAAAAAPAAATPSATAPPAGSATGFDQLSGSGATSSSVQVDWTSGLLNSDNTPIGGNPAGELNSNADRQNGTGSYAFMDDGFTGTAGGQSLSGYGAFKNLQFTVSQTQDVGRGGISVSWTGGTATATSGGIGTNFLQLMECWGNSPDGPDPEDCEYGASSEPGDVVPLLPPSIVQAAALGARTGVQCSSHTLSTSNPTGPAGCDPAETDPSHDPCPPPPSGVNDCIPGGFSIPFDPAGDDQVPLYTGELNEAYDQFGTNEDDFAQTRSDGTGQVQFETLTTIQSSGLGCGQPLPADGGPQGCWLVIVPRGVYEPNGGNVLSESSPRLNSSPLSAGNWAQRVQVHLDYAPLPVTCPLGSGRDSFMEGSQLITRAVQSWELKLNEQANCTLTYHLAETSEQQVTGDFAEPYAFDGPSTNGLAFTTDPVGQEAVRNGESPPALPGIVYAPVAVAAIDFGFNVNQYDPGGGHPNGYLSQPVVLTPQLLARALSQSYQDDLPDVAPQSGDPGPDWVAGNPLNITQDKTFEDLNPEVVPWGFAAASLAPLDTIDHSAYYQQVWQWIQEDPTAAGWLDGAADPQVTVDPAYAAEQLGKPPAIDSMPRSYPACLDIVADGAPESFCSTDQLPYVTDFDAASADMLAGNPETYGNQWCDCNTAPNGTAGYWSKNAPEPPGDTFEWAVDATPYTAAYGLTAATLCNDSGGDCISPTVASVSAAVNDAKPDSAGLLQVNPASPGAGGYPLTEVIYAAVRTDMPAQALTDYASFISFATSQGQSPGQAGGDLPPGYLPLPATLAAQAASAVTQLKQIAANGPAAPAGAGPQPSAAPPAGETSSGGSGASGAASGGAGTASGNPGKSPIVPLTGVSPGKGGSSVAAPSASATAAGPVIEPPTVAIAPAGNTPGQPVGPARAVLAVVAIAGFGGAGAGIFLRRGRLPRRPGGPGT